jgi:hypothetical protein
MTTHTYTPTHSIANESTYVFDQAWYKELKLPALLTAAGLEDVGAEVHAPLVSGDTPDGWVPLSFEHLFPRVRGAGLLAEAEFEPAFLADQKGRYLPPFMVTAWGQCAPG